ncbi:hypothetical protein FPF71_02625 [Algibacter amylolyticus]|uniref:Uncharacterized protein n=1 Tax=Algibacter amylolyticus TaxID=1608400 RepID=A0A5M7BFW0_9FLAO|nr:hypothetical protein [Algibacter amylolyticus]KAA5827750.1 hypothetical protein F2B50_02625 [Algibacter amylolyticus]MBB5266973.1 hypothetical protein [Algibacter amylolyticus]TSJ81995.1 hypothetical protein FPF71_02625 [Algibacter amylolyticus]
MSIGLKRVPYSGGRKQGPNKWGEEVFGEGDYNKTVREITQNSSDNPKDINQLDPVKIKIESFEVDVNQIPGSQELKDSFKCGLNYLKAGYDESGVTCSKFQKGIDLLSGDKITILKFSDYNTTGLYGDWDDTSSPIYRFFASVGYSIEGGEGGGSRGHGKTAPFNLSRINTVFYSSYSKHEGKEQHTFFGSTDLIYFEQEGQKYKGEIFFCDHDDGTEYRTITYDSFEEAKRTIPSWMAQRTEEGTDVYVVGFEPKSDDWEDLIIKSYMRNFYAAIIDNKITVEINGKLLDSNTINTIQFISLFDKNDKQDRTLQYIDAYMNGHSETRELPLLGKCCVKVIQKDGYARSYDMMRSRKMMIQDQRKRTWSSYDYSAVFCCESTHGSEILRKTEGSTHRAWDFKSLVGGEKYRVEIRDFIREVVTAVAGSGASDEEDVQVAELFAAGIGLSGGGQNTASAEITDNETGRKLPQIKKDNIIPVNVKSGTVRIDPNGNIKKARPIKEKRKKKTQEKTNPNTSNKRKKYSVSEFPHVVVRNEKDLCFDVHIENIKSVDIELQTLSFNIPDENGNSLDIKLMNTVKDNRGDSLLTKSTNTFGPLRLTPGSNIIKAYPDELNVLILIS